MQTSDIQGIFDAAAADREARPSMWQPIATAPKDRPVLLWFPDGDFACRGNWECIEGGNEDGTGSKWAWIVADDFSEQHDGIVWADSAQPTLWTELPA